MAGINAKAGEHNHGKLMGKCYVNCHSQDARSASDVRTCLTRALPTQGWMDVPSLFQDKTG